MRDYAKALSRRPAGPLRAANSAGRPALSLTARAGRSQRRSAGAKAKNPLATSAQKTRAVATTRYHLP